MAELKPEGECQDILQIIIKPTAKIATMYHCGLLQLSKISREIQEFIEVTSNYIDDAHTKIHARKK